MMTTILRILAAGILAGVLINSGAADKIARTVIDALGEKRLFSTFNFNYDINFSGCIY